MDNSHSSQISQNSQPSRPSINDHGSARLNTIARFMEMERDVKQVIHLMELPCGRIRYLIETPFTTFPTHVIGTCNESLDLVHHEFKTTSLVPALEQWEHLKTIGRLAGPEQPERCGNNPQSAQ